MENTQNSCEFVAVSDQSFGLETLDHTVLEEVRELADHQGCPQEEMVVALLRQALHMRRRQGQTYHSWESLSQREKQVAALVCSGMTGRQIAARLVLSPETIKTHVRHILAKFSLNSRQDFRNLLAGWDFSRWLGMDRSLVLAEPVGFQPDLSRDLFDPLHNDYD